MVSSPNITGLTPEKLPRAIRRHHAFALAPCERERDASSCIMRHHDFALADVLHVVHATRGSNTHLVEMFRLSAPTVFHPILCLQPHRGLLNHILRCKDSDLLLELERHVAGNTQ